MVLFLITIPAAVRQASEGWQGAVYLILTGAVLDLGAGRWNRKSARNALASAEDPVVLSLTVWELARKLRLGKLQLPCEQDGVLEFVEAVCRRYKIRLLPVAADVCESAELLPAHHEDPFDRIIIARARLSGCPVFTTDRRFALYPVEVLPQR